MTVLSRVDDPRNNLKKATRWELIQFARSKGVNIDPEMPAELMRDILADNGHTDIQLPPRVLGSPNYWGRGKTATSVPPMSVKADNTVNAKSDLARQWREQQKPKETKSYNEMRADLKAAGVKLDRKWSKQDVTERWEQIKRG